MEELEMEDARAIDISSSPPAEIQSQISALICGYFDSSSSELIDKDFVYIDYDSFGPGFLRAVSSETWQQVQDAMESMVKMTNEIEQTSAEIVEEIEKCKESVLVRSKVLEEEKESLQRAALAVLQIFNPDAI